MDRYIDLRGLDRFVNGLSAVWWYYLALGLLLIAWGIAVAIWPQLLVALVAALFIVAGIMVLGIAWKVWQIQRSYRSYRRNLLRF